MSDQVSDPEVAYVTEPAEAPPIPPEEMASRMSLEELEGVIGSFKGYLKAAKGAEQTALGQRCLRKAEYWRRVADLLTQRAEGAL